MRGKMYTYYDDNLSAERLKQAYEIAPPPVKRYLKAEIDHALERIEPTDVVLELGCGYGRVMSRLATKAGAVIGIDISPRSLLLGKQELAGLANCQVACMDAADLGFRDSTFDCVLCLQNGISAFHVDKLKLARGRKIVEDHYARKSGASYKGCDTYGDLRDVIAREDIDAVVISTPDHWHAITVIQSAQAGKDIYCEKPLSQTIEEARAMVNAVRRYGRVFQTGSSQPWRKRQFERCMLPVWKTRP